VKPKVLAAVVAALLVVGGGAFALTRFLAPADDAAVALAPADTLMYANLFIRPSNDQKLALDDLLRKFPGVESADDVIQKIVDALDEEIADQGFTYEEDIEPWLGDQLALFVAPGPSPDEPAAAFMAESKDDGAADQFIRTIADEEGVSLEDRDHEGVSYRADPEEDGAVVVLDGFLVFGTEDGVKAAIDSSRSEDGTLEAAEDFVAATDPLRDDWLGLFYFDTAGVISEFSMAEELTSEERQAIDALRLDEQEPAAGVVYVTDDAVVFEGSSGTFDGLGGDGSDGRGIVPELPGGTWAAIGMRGLGDTIDGFFDTFGPGVPGFDRAQLEAMFEAQTGLRLDQDVLSWMGDAGLFVEGTSIQDIGGGLVIESSDPAKTAALLREIEGAVAGQGVDPKPEKVGDLEGFSVQVPGVPAPFYALGGERLVLAYGDSATATAGDGRALEDSEAFRAAQEDVGDDFDIGFFLDVDAAQAFGEAAAGFSGAPMEEYERDVKPYLDVLTHVVAASKTDGDRTVQKLVIGVR
jgi:hypothetical protein